MTRLPLVLLLFSPFAFAGTLGGFTQGSDIGALSKPLAASFEPANDTYTVSAGGENMWGAHDAFGFVWKQMRGDVAIGARVEIQGTSEQAHRKAGLMLRQSLAPDSAYVDLVVHGNGLTSLQYREVAGGPTREIQCSQRAAAIFKLEKRGDVMIVSLADTDGIWDKPGCTIRVTLQGSFYAGLVLCAHASAGYETALFKHVTLGKPGERTEARVSAIETVEAAVGDRRLIFHSGTHLNAASFTVAGDAVCYRDDGPLMRFALSATREPAAVGAENVADCATAYAPGISIAEMPASAKKDGKISQPHRSPDGLSIAYLLSHMGDSAERRLMVIPAAGGEPRELARFEGTDESLGRAPWSPDSLTLVFTSHEAD
jgi:TolB protein